MSCGLMASLIIEASQTDALMAAEVTPAFHRAKTTRAKQLAYRCGLVEAMLQQQPATCFKIVRCLLDDQANIVQPIRARHQGAARLEAHIAVGQVPIIASDIGRVADDQLITLLGQGTKP